MSVLNNDVNALETFLEDGLSATLWIAATVVGIGLILVGLNVPDGGHPVTDPAARSVHPAVHPTDRAAVSLDPRGDRGSELPAGEQRQRH